MIKKVPKSLDRGVKEKAALMNWETTMDHRDIRLTGEANGSEIQIDPDKVDDIKQWRLGRNLQMIKPTLQHSSSKIWKKNGFKEIK